MSQPSPETKKGSNNSVSIFHRFGSVVAEPFFQLGGTTMAIAKRPGYNTLPNKTEHHRISLILKGEMEFKINDQRILAKPGDMVITPANSISQRKADAPIEWMYFDINDNLFWKPLCDAESLHRAYESFEIIVPLTRSIIRALRSTDLFTLRSAYENSGMLATLLKREIWNNGEPSKNHLTDTVLDLVEQVKNHPEKEWSRPSLAKKARMSERNLTRAFGKVFGVTPSKMILRVRMEKAMTSLRENQQSIEQIGNSVGYESLVSFSRAFKTHLGISPSSYRSKAQEV